MPILSANNTNLYYEETGEGETIVFLHGYTGSSQDWANQISSVSKKYRAVAMDSRGHGRSEAPTEEEDYSVKIFSEDVYALLLKLGIEKCCLVGHSMGGFMALQFVLDHPEIIKALVLVDTSSGEFEVAPGYAELRAKLDELARNDNRKIRKTSRAERSDTAKNDEHFSRWLYLRRQDFWKMGARHKQAE